jgi:hypothetical protein
LLRTQDVVHEGSNSLLIETDVGLDAELHQFHRCLGNRGQTICGG